MGETKNNKVLDEALPDFMVDAMLKSDDFVSEGEVSNEMDAVFERWYKKLSMESLGKKSIEVLLKNAFTQGVLYAESTIPKCAIDTDTGKVHMMDAGLFDNYHHFFDDGDFISDEDNEEKSVGGKENKDE